MPVPGSTNDRLEVMPGRPTDGPLRQSIVGDQGGRVAIATRPVLNIEIPAYDLLNGREQLLHGRAMAGSEIQGVAGSVAQKVLDRAGMGIGKIENVDEVAHAGSITRVIVRAQNLKMWPAAQSGLDRNRYGVSFRRMPFANSSLRVCSGGVKIAQNKRPKALVEVQILQYLLDDELASTVRIDWQLGVSLIHRY